MPLSAATRQIVDVLRQIAGEYSFGFAAEARYFPYLGEHSERVDVEFLLTEGKPALRFEIDNNPDRAAHNRLKIFGNVYSLSALPLVSLSVLHGHAAAAPHAYPAELLSRGFTPPPRFLDTVTVDNSSVVTMTTQLHEWLKQLIAALATAPEGDTVFDIAKQYQPLIANLSLDVAAAHLRMHSELAWFLVAKDHLSYERAASLSVTLARMLQRAGYHADAVQIIRQLRSRFTGAGSMSVATEDDARAVEFLLASPSLHGEAALTYLSDAVNGLHAQYHRSKFHWRKGIVEVLSGNPRRAEDVSRSYLEEMSDSRIALSNVALVRTIAALRLGRGDPREQAATYAKYERFLLFKGEGAPDGTVHGVVASLYLQVLAEIACGNTAAKYLLSGLDAFCVNAGIPRTADGLREISSVLPSPPEDRQELRQTNSGSLAALMTRGRKEVLWQLCTEVDLVCK